MEILEDIVLGELPNYLNTLHTPLTQHVRITIEDVVPTENPKKLRFSDTPLCGMWKNREDMKNPTEWVANLRKPRF